MKLSLKTLPVNKQFSRRLIAEDTWILNPFDPGLAFPRPYVLIGEKYALVIDTTYTALPLRAYIETCVTDKPLKVFSTHSHFDHTNGNGHFNDVPIYMSQYAWEEIKERRKLDAKEGRWQVYDAENNAIDLTEEEIGDYVPEILKPGDTIDLGNRILEVLPYEGCHSPGSLVLLDHNTGYLFTGDEIECGQMLVMGRGKSSSCIELLKENIDRLREGWGDQITMLCPPHNGSPIHVKFLDYLSENCQRIMDGEEGDMDVGSMTYLYNPKEDRPVEMIKAQLENPDILRSEWKGTSIVYSRQRIFKKQLENL